METALEMYGIIRYNSDVRRQYPLQQAAMDITLESCPSGRRCRTRNAVCVE